MICPRCQTPDLTELDHDGVTIDRCPRCRGVWLDRGELDKLLARARDESGDDRDDDDDRSRDRDRDRDDDDDRGRTRGKRRWSLWDIFD